MRQTAIEKAKTHKCHVKMTGRRTYLVTTPAGHRYTVRFVVMSGVEVGSCNCASRGPCYHLVSASQAHLIITGVMAQAAPHVAAGVLVRSQPASAGREFGIEL
jgi:hypothetical protein